MAPSFCLRDSAARRLAPSALLRDSPELPPTPVAFASDTFTGNKDTLAQKVTLVKRILQKTYFFIYILYRDFPVIRGEVASTKAPLAVCEGSASGAVEVSTKDYFDLFKI